MKLQHVELQYTNQVWPQVAEFIEAARAQQLGEPDYTLDQIKTHVTLGLWMLIVVVGDAGDIRGAITVNFTNRPNDRIAFVTYIGGKIIANHDTFKQLCALCKAFGATKIEGAVSKSVARLWRRYGFQEKYSIVEVSLT